MKSRITIAACVATAAAMMLAFAACSKSKPTQANPQQGGQTGPEWSLTLKTKCLDGSQDTCVGYYGFGVDATGKYTVGSELPSHPARVRTLASDENQAIKSLVKPYIDALKKGTEQKETCSPQPDDEPSLDNEQVLTLNRLGASFVLSSDTVKESCTGVLDAKSAHDLATQIEALATAHYPSPWPDPCLDQVDQFVAKYAPLETCSADTDCAYVGDGFSVIPYDSNQAVMMEDFSKVTPLVVANAAKVTAEQTVLTDAYAALQQSCGDGFWRDPVPATLQQFNSSAGNPLCQQGTCKVNPAVFATRR